MRSRFRSPDGLVHASIGNTNNKSAMECEVDGNRHEFKWDPSDLTYTDEPPTCFDCARKAR